MGAGLIGGAVMAMLLYMGIGMMPRQMRMSLFLMPGTTMHGIRMTDREKREIRMEGTNVRTRRLARIGLWIREARMRR